jgi:preprotein translocase subunit SecD
MPKQLRNRLLLPAVLTLAGLFCAAPSLTQHLPDWWRKVLLSGGMRLGLDLQGGMHLILKW